MIDKKSTRAQEHRSTRLGEVPSRSQISNLCTCALMTCALILSGCASQQPCEIATGPLCVTGLEKIAVMKVAEDVLAEMHFTIEKADVESGLIRTSPLSGAQFFELWRSDNVGALNSAESNLHSIRRAVELNITQQDKKLCLGCNVKVERLSLPEREVGSSRAYQMFSKSTASLQKLTLDPRQKAGMAWVDLGRDSRLAAEILKRISSMLDARRSSILRSGPDLSGATAKDESLDIEYRESSIE